MDVIGRPQGFDHQMSTCFPGSEICDGLWQVGVLYLQKFVKKVNIEYHKYT